MTEPFESVADDSAAVGAIGGTLAVLLGFTVSPAGPVVVAATTALATPYTTRLVARAASEWRRKGDTVAETALAASGVSDDEFFERLIGTPGLTELAQKILWAAWMSGNEDKLRTLGQLLGGAVKDRGDRLDEAQILAAALTDLEVPHVAVLDILTGPAPEHEAMLAQVAGDMSAGWWSSAQVEASIRLEPSGVVLACLGTLVRHGLAEVQSGYGGQQKYKLTELGREMADVMSRAGAHT